MNPGAARAGGLRLTGLSLDEMDLSPLAKQGAVLLLEACPTVIFTSGRRDRWAQAWAMASNIQKAGRGWIQATYKQSEVATALHVWLQQHPTIESAGDLAQGLYDEMVLWSDAELRSLSRHCSGDAFDILPMVDEHGRATPDGEKVLDVVAQLPGLERFLTKEGGLVRWHVQFLPSAEV